MVGSFLIFIAGLVIYAGYGLAGLAYLLGATVLSYLVGLLIPRHRWLMWVSVTVQALVLLAVKLQPVTGWVLLVPLGISYFTFQIISYHADLYLGKYEPERNFLRYGLYVTYLPHIFMGPIERYPVMGPALFENRRTGWDDISKGAARMALGFFKRLVIASRAGVIVSAISADPQQYRGAFALLAMAAYAVQLYADFSGGMDLVLGGSRILGIRLSENFDAPYFSQSFREFWRRWHMTLGSFLRDYVYIPLGGSRRGKFRKYLNTIITFLVSGIWHGAQYVVWGLLNGIFVCFGEKFKTRWKLLNQVMMFIMVSFLWSFFIWPDTVTALQMMGSVFADFHPGLLVSGIAGLGLNLAEWLVLLAGTGLLWIYDLKRKTLSVRFSAMAPWARMAVICGAVLLILVFGMYGIGFQAEAFIYSRF